MNITVKQLNDIISLATVAIFKKEETTLPDLSKTTLSPLEGELLRILDNECSTEDIHAINDHVAAIRIGVEASNLVVVREKPKDLDLSNVIGGHKTVLRTYPRNRK